MTQEQSQQSNFTIFGQQHSAPTLEAGLYIVSTPIGNLGDMTLRALQSLAAADAIACEDTRTSRPLLNHYGIKRPLIACHEHNEQQAAEKICNMIEAGKAVCFISDAGTPAISDPGERLVGAAIKEGLPVWPIPGASAVLTALVASGLPTENFCFIGFLPKKANAMRSALNHAANNIDNSTAIFYESPRRIEKTLEAMAEVFGPDTKCCIARELTKLHETFLRGTISSVMKQIEDGAVMKGEAVILLHAEYQQEEWNEAQVDALLCELIADKPASKAANEAAKMTGLEKQVLFDRITELRKAQEQNNAQS